MLEPDYETKMLDEKIETKEDKISYASKPGKGIFIGGKVDEFLDSRGYSSCNSAKKDGWKFK